MHPRIMEIIFNITCIIIKFHSNVFYCPLAHYIEFDNFFFIHKISHVA